MKYEILNTSVMDDTKNKKPKKDLSRLKKKNKAILEKVKQWQAFPYVRPMVCRNEACKNIKLKPKETRMRVMLQCPRCKKTQTYVPKVVLTTNLSIPEVLLRNKSRISHKKG